MDRRRRLTIQDVGPPVDEYEDEDESESESEEEDTDEEGEEDEEDAVPVPARFSPTESSPLSGEVRDDAAKRGISVNRDGGGTAPLSLVEDSEMGGGCNREETEGLLCPICYEAWSNGGEHYPSCLPCGHLYGMSCIKKWFRQRRSSNKCPQCNTKCTMKDIRRIYGSRVLVHDDELQKRIQYLETKCDALEKKDADWRRKEAEWLKRDIAWLKRESDLQMQLHRERAINQERLGVLQRDRGSQEPRTGCNHDATFGSSVSHHDFVLQKEIQVNGARFFDVDAAGHTLIIARKLSGLGGRHAITRMSLVYPHDQEDITLPVNVKVVKDIHVSPFARLALMASSGKKLSVLSLESNNVVLNYDLTVPAWSCSWDMKSSHYVYAGLQNGMLLVFDTRQTARPLESRTGLTGNPIHTICSLSTDSTVPSDMGTLLTASSAGLCQWSVGCGPEKPSMVPETENQGVCISLAYCSTSDYLVSTYRPKIEMLNEFSVSQQFLTPSSAMGQSVQGSHVIIRRLGKCYEKFGSKLANVPSIRLPKCAVMDTGSGLSFASADEVTSELVLQELPSLTTTDRLKSYYPIRDMKYDSALHPRSLICLSEDKLQLFSPKFF